MPHLNPPAGSGRSTAQSRVRSSASGEEHEFRMGSDKTATFLPRLRQGDGSAIRMVESPEGLGIAAAGTSPRHPGAGARVHPDRNGGSVYWCSLGLVLGTKGTPTTRTEV